MRTIETQATVTPDGTLTIHLPPDVPPGKHRIVLKIDEPPVTGSPRAPLDLPIHDCGPWPKQFSLRREELYGDNGR